MVARACAGRAAYAFGGRNNPTFAASLVSLGPGPKWRLFQAKSGQD